MLRSKLMGLVAIESMFISVIGLVLGVLISAPVLAYFYINPIEITGDAAQVMLESGFEPIVPVSLPILFKNHLKLLSVNQHQ
ncbi:MAG: hypothetical protein JKY95_18795, partial [Planctomycetaceae bacterium]|nr:hypothetical protein [Planctomycetaceae bacterium]